VATYWFLGPPCRSLRLSRILELLVALVGLLGLLRFSFCSIGRRRTIRLREPQRAIAVGEDDPDRTIMETDRKVPLRDHRTPDLIGCTSCVAFRLECHQ